MRSLDRDRHEAFIARFEEVEKAKDDRGRFTGESSVKRSDPVAFEPTKSATRGEVYTDHFGQDVDYDRSITIDDPDFVVGESDWLWIDNVPPAEHDYIVKRVARSPNFTVVAIQQDKAAK